MRGHQGLQQGTAADADHRIWWSSHRPSHLGPALMARRRALKDMIEPIDRHEPIDSSDPHDAIEPTDRNEPTDPTDSTEPLEPIDSTEF
jgi:hypothetical protein